MNTSNKSVVYTSDRGNDIYSRENEMIRIKIDASTCAMLNTKASFLRYSLKINHDGARVKPDDFLHPFKNIYIYDGNESCLLEQMNDTDISFAIKNYYGSSSNDRNMQTIFEGKVNDNFPFLKTEDDFTNAYNNNRGGGFKNPFVSFSEDMQNEGNRKAELIYNFPLSGILGPKLNYVFPVMAVGGLVLRIELMDPMRYFTLQYVIDPATEAPAIGYGDIDNIINQTFGLEANNDYSDSIGNYTIFSYLDQNGDNGNGGNTAGDYGGNTQISGIILQKAGDGGNGYLVDDVENVGFIVGSRIKYGNNGEQDAQTKSVGFFPVDGDADGAKVTRIKRNANGRIEIHFDTLANAPAFTSGDPIIPYVITAKPTFEVSDVQYIANVVETDPKLLEEQVSLFQSGRLPLPIKSYSNVRVNIANNALQNEINIPVNYRFVYSVLAYPEENRAQELYLVNSRSAHAGVRNYNWVLNGLNIPNLPVNLERVANGRVNALALKEVEKALKETSIDIKNLRDPNNMFLIGRRLGVYSEDGRQDGTYNTIEQPIKLRVNYSLRDSSLVYNFIFFHYKQIRQEGNRRVVIE